MNIIFEKPDTGIVDICKISDICDGLGEITDENDAELAMHILNGKHYAGLTGSISENSNQYRQLTTERMQECNIGYNDGLRIRPLGIASGNLGDETEVWAYVFGKTGKSKRNLNIPTQKRNGFGGTVFKPQSQTHGYSVDTFVDASFTKFTQNVVVEPYAAAGLTLSTIRGASEHDGGGAELIYPNHSTTVPTLSAGLRLGSAVDIAAARIGIRGNFGWEHRFGDINDRTTMRYAVGGDEFSVLGTEFDQDIALVGAGFDVTHEPTSINFFFDYCGQIGRKGQDHLFRAGISYRF